ncbi:hypothetical protein P175DRAFT_0125347 [Aspergillus ochraceoroseus IBT 24754]|uniref:Uncharacterized protein n=1 Tax=Aspergillus ochraceoroseus IBT 24754 TaxID=1392256 RepID=A0A2T5LKR2_9EURO|nr:hypothetical protein P175DRAFT_0125347 [Aspergillus ochraceoroseus IBT 24754]
MSFANVPVHGVRRPSVAAVRRRDCWVRLPERGPDAAGRCTPPGDSAGPACGSVPGGLTVGSGGPLLRPACARPVRWDEARRSRGGPAPSRVKTDVRSASLRGGRLGVPPGLKSRGCAPRGPRYLVDSASSHMLVSKIKPCMSKYKQL